MNFFKRLLNFSNDNSTAKNNFIDDSNKIKGSIRYLGLTDWWLSAFTDFEREYILKTFNPLSYGAGESSLVKGDISHSNETASNLLSDLSAWFRKENDRTIGYRLINKAEESITPNTNFLDIHFLYLNKIEIYYKFRRQDEFALDQLIDACIKQIDNSARAKILFKKEYKGDPLPCHTGFEKLINIEMDRDNFEIAIDLAKKASKEGWEGYWKETIKECKEELKSKKK